MQELFSSMVRSAESSCALMNLRKQVKESLNLNERGASSVIVESGVMRVARALLKGCSKQEVGVLVCGGSLDRIGHGDIATLWGGDRDERAGPIPNPAD